MYGPDFPLAEDALFRLKLRRATISEDTFEQLDAVHRKDYKKILEVYVNAVAWPEFA